jgi:hypothetical protein
MVVLFKNNEIWALREDEKKLVKIENPLGEIIVKQVYINQDHKHA